MLTVDTKQVLVEEPPNAAFAKVSKSIAKKFVCPLLSPKTRGNLLS